MITDDSSLFDSLNQDILNLGFTTQTLSRLETLTRQVNDGTALSERIPQAQQSGLSKGSTVLTAAAIIVEYIDDDMSVVQDDAATNFLLTPGEYDFGKGEDRYATLRETLDANGGIFENGDLAMNLLEAVSQQVSEEKKSSTQWSCVYDQHAVSVDIAMNMNYEKVYTFGL